jgi:hypothetical protein
MELKYLYLILFGLVSVVTGYYFALIISPEGTRLRSSIMSQMGLLIKLFFIASSVFTGYMMASIVMPPRAKMDIVSIDSMTLNVDSKCHLVFLGYVANNGKVTAYNIEVIVNWKDSDGEVHTGSVNLGTMSAGEFKFFEVVFVLSSIPDVSSYTQMIRFSNTPK